MYRDDAHCRTAEMNNAAERSYVSKKRRERHRARAQQAGWLPKFPTAQVKHRSATSNRLLRKYFEVQAFKEHTNTRPIGNEYLLEMMLGKMISKQLALLCR